MICRLSIPHLLLLAAWGDKDVKPFDFGEREPYVPLGMNRASLVPDAAVTPRSLP